MRWVYALLSALVIGAGVWTYFDRDVGLNFLAEAVGTFVTVLGVELLIARAEKRRLAPVHRMARRDVHSILTILYSIVSGVMKCVVKLEELPLTPLETKRKDLLNRFNSHSIAATFYLDQTGAKSFHRPLWSTYLPEEITKLENEINRFVERYVGFASPATLEAMHDLQSTLLFKLLRQLPQALAVMEDGSFEGYIEELARCAEDLRKAASKMPMSAKDTPFPDFGEQMAVDVEAHVRETPYASPFFEHRPPAPT